jgi:hypothetical protein
LRAKLCPPARTWFFRLSGRALLRIALIIGTPAHEIRNAAEMPEIH